MKRRVLLRSIVLSCVMPIVKLGLFEDDSDLIEHLQRNGGGLISDRVLRLSRPIVLQDGLAKVTIERCRIYSTAEAAIVAYQGGAISLLESVIVMQIGANHDGGRFG